MIFANSYTKRLIPRIKYTFRLRVANRDISQVKSKVIYNIKEKIVRNPSVREEKLSLKKIKNEAELSKVKHSRSCESQSLF